MQTRDFSWIDPTYILPFLKIFCDAYDSTGIWERVATWLLPFFFENIDIFVTWGLVVTGKDKRDGVALREVVRIRQSSQLLAIDVCIRRFFFRQSGIRSRTIMARTVCRNEYKEAIHHCVKILNHSREGTFQVYARRRLVWVGMQQYAFLSGTATTCITHKNGEVCKHAHQDRW